MYFPSVNRPGIASVSETIIAHVGASSKDDTEGRDLVAVPQ